MQKVEYDTMTDEALLLEKKKMARSKLRHALSIGFLAGILIFGVVSWILSPDKKLNFWISALMPIVLIRRLLKTPNKNVDLEEELKNRALK